ncbi:MAG: hypothetical protein QM756_17610 [Polyangiaceae bacterium]
MSPGELLSELLLVAEHIGLEIRAFGLKRKNAGAGGLCNINGRAVVILNLQSSPIERSTVLADALAGRELSSQRMPDEVRHFIAARARSRSRLLTPRRAPGPGLSRCGHDLGRRHTKS